jgi:hypothetical protein
MEVEFTKKVSKSVQLLCFLKICPLVADVFHVDGRTDGQKIRS